MKKVIKCLGMMALVALAFTSCKKTEQSTTKVTMPQLIVEDEDRAYIDASNHVTFEIGDRLMIFNISKTRPGMSHCATYRAIEEGSHVEFVNSGMGTVGVALDGGYYAYYPSTLVAEDPNTGFGGFVSDRVETELEFGENKSKFFVSPEQEYREGYVARKDFYLAGKDDHATLSDADFQMQFVCGVIRLRPFEAAKRTIKKIEVIDNFFNLSGWVEVIIPEIDPNEMTTLFNGFNPTNTEWVAALEAWKTKTGYNVTGDANEIGKVITLTLPEAGVQLGDNKNNTPVFNIVLRPLALCYGCTFRITYADDSVKDCVIPANALKVKPNVTKTVNLDLDGF